ncbi:fungal-specific transcription factor domain-containing protein [Aspergillus granulosus]|uniref:Fungal-specific transcription factor domain-containing protein n=1 Tax=Aspergillus granulosus TaxID=176169 RepID=A0ABR4GSG7_9EURO
MEPSAGNSSTPTSQPLSTRSRRRRAPEACSFCRRRKIKCNSEKPICINCKTYAQDCVYEPISEAAREAGRGRSTRRKTQENLTPVVDNHRSPQTPQTLQNVEGVCDLPDPEVVAATGTRPDGGLDEASVVATPSRARVARILVSANGVSSYHGHTSAFFEEHTQDRPSGVDHRPRMSDDWVERGLVAEAAKQRQMEQLNFGQNKLDFDGVDPDLGMHLLSLHWNRQHHSFLITYRPAFMRDMACNGPYFSKILLNAIYFGAAKFSPRLEVRKDPNDVRTAGWKYRERVRELLGGALDCSDITTIQALLVMTNSLFALGDERSAAWLYAGLAFRMLTDLGMHVDLTSTHRFSDEDLEIRRRIFWGAFVVDKVQSLYQGRPVSLKETDALVPIKFLDTYEELEHWMPFAYSTCAPDYPGTPAYSTSTFTFLCKLSLIMSDILNCIYTERSFDQSPTDLANMLDRVQLRLDQWRASLPEHLRFDPGRSHTLAFPPPHVSSLHAMFNVLVILLHRPFVADGHLYSTSRTISVDCFKKCASAAANISSLLRGYHRAFSIRRAPYLISYATYVAATILTRIAARRRNDSTAHANLATCLAVFEENQETNSAVRKAAMIIHNLMKKLGVVIDNLSIDALGPDPQGRSSDQELPRHASVDGNMIYLMNSQNATGNTNATGVATEPANIMSPNQVVYSPDSDWVDIDGIIQSFLQENGGRGARLTETDIEGIPSHIPRTPLIPHQGVAHLPGDMDNAPFVGHHASPGRDISATNGVHRSEAVTGIYQWQHGWRFINGESASLDDPLFGFNGSSLDSLTLAEW